jgi:hypothetical protein
MPGMRSLWLSGYILTFRRNLLIPLSDHLHSSKCWYQFTGFHSVTIWEPGSFQPVVSADMFGKETRKLRSDVLSEGFL